MRISDWSSDVCSSDLIASGAQRDLRHANIAKLFQRIPGTNDWSGLLDIGGGLQLYRIDNAGSIAPLIVNPATVAVGRADLSLPVGGGTVPHHVGVLASAWSPDGQWLWYRSEEHTSELQSLMRIS